MSLYNPHCDKIAKSVENICNKHAGDFHSIILGWEVKKTNHPNYAQPIEQLVPLIVIDWK